MDSQVSYLLIPQKSSSPINGDTRRSANFPPNIWGDYFLSGTFRSTEIEDNIEEKVEALEEEVRKLLFSYVEKSSQQLSLIDSIQRLGIAYHFDTEINEALDHVYKNYSFVSNESQKDLHIVALKFHLLRQQRYSISCEIFDKFTNDEGNFKESLANEVRGMLSLYEASHMRMHGEDVLERALTFSTINLEAAINNGSHEGSCGFGAQVRHALKWPVFKAMPRLAARSYISFYEEDPLHHPALLSMAKLDFNILQKLYQKELHEISRMCCLKWWKELKLVEKLCFARDRCVECYTWALGTYFEPKYSLGRIILSKIVVITSVLDDIFDLRGTFEELQLFIHAIERWDDNCIDQLPKYMKVYCEVLMDTYRRIEQNIRKDGIPYATHYAKEAIYSLLPYLYS
ncbi:(-)-germacrene D synthase-like [Momordica charantia]|uniref:(-)-germacrene D synthase-like n=1 Tax=Momordica charantia TaxID=3673 RepID=A0A6J1DKI4_MOMCH|nr:(-)-germacrene D synthase-like [Momordica charantia]